MRRLAAAYLVVQAAGFAAWWTWLAIDPPARRHFALGGAPDAALFGFAPADAAVIAGSIAIAIGVARRRPWIGPLVWLVTGAVGYAALYCQAAWALTGDAGLAAASMTAALAATALAARTLARELAP